MEGQNERDGERFKQDEFVRPSLNLNTVSNKGVSSLGFEEGVLFELRDKERVVLNSSLPRAEWYELVEIAQSPSDSQEIWIGVGGKDLYCSIDGGRNFGRVKNVSYVSDISFVPVLNSERHHSLYLFGCLTDGRRGGFTSADGGRNWQAYDPARLIPFV